MKKLLISALLFVFSFSPVVATAEEGDAVRIDLLKTTTTWNGSELPCYPKGQPEITVFKGIIPPGAMSSLHKHPTIGAYVILKGELTVITKNNDVLYAVEGDAYTEVIDEWHYGINEGTETVELLFFIAGAEGVPNTIEYDEDTGDHDDGREDRHCKHKKRHCKDKKPYREQHRCNDN